MGQYFTPILQLFLHFLIQLLSFKLCFSLNWVNFLSSTLNKVKDSITKSADDVIKQIKTMNAEDDDMAEDSDNSETPAERLSKKEKKELERANLIKKARQEKIDAELENADYPVIKRKSDKDFKFRSGLSARCMEIGATVPLTKQYNFLPIEQPNFLVGDYDDDEGEEEGEEDEDNEETGENDGNDENKEFEASVSKLEKRQAKKVPVSESYAKQELDSKIQEIQTTIEKKLAGLKNNANLEKINAYIGKRIVNKRTKRLQFDKQIQLEKTREKSRSDNSKTEKELSTPDTIEPGFDLFVDNNRQTVDNSPVNKDDLKYFCPESESVQAEICEGIEFKDIRYRSPVQDVPVEKISIKTKDDDVKLDDSGNLVVKIWRGLMSLISKSRDDEVEKEEREKRELVEKLESEKQRLEKERVEEERVELERIRQELEFEAEAEEAKKVKKAEKAKKSKKSKESSEKSFEDSEVVQPVETPIPNETIAVDEQAEEEDEYDELMHDLTSWLDHFDDISLPELPKFNFIVFITCLIGQLR